jgi:hypothetical protein
MNIIWVVVIVVFVFLISYNPSTGTLEKYMPKKEKYEEVPQANPPLFDRRLTQCDESRYLDLQLGSPGPCMGEPQEYLGAVISV